MTVNVFAWVCVHFSALLAKYIINQKIDLNETPKIIIDVHLLSVTFLYPSWFNMAATANPNHGFDEK